MPETQHVSPIPCLGILGRWFGHKFSKYSYERRADHCWRCGMPLGGWERLPPA